MSVTISAENLPEDLSVNMSNSNAGTVLATLGISLAPDYCGELSAEDFLGRVLMALAISPADEGMPSYEHERIPGSARMIEGARRPGYLQERLTQLRSIADWAVENGTEVYWG